MSLGGNRRGGLRTYVNLMLVMVLGGLWHGAAYTFLAWGALHGGALVLERLLGLHQSDRRWTRSAAVRAGWFVVVQGMVLAAWVCFRSRSIEEARLLLGNIAALDHWTIGKMELAGLLFLLPLAVLHAYTWLRERRLVMPLRPPYRAALAASMVYAIVTLYAGTADFIYFQF